MKAMLAILLLLLPTTLHGEGLDCPDKVVRSLRWGVATSAYQIEGGARAGGRTPSVWDTFDARRVADNSTGNVAVDAHRLFSDDVRLMRSLGIRHYRLSISWSRLLPQARKGTATSSEGVQYYGQLLQALVANGITPYVTLFHWDLPQLLEDAYQGPLGDDFAADFEFYARTAFELFHPVVRHWVTFNEPYNTCVLQYATGAFAPGTARGQQAQYRCGHNVLKAHAAAAQAFRQHGWPGKIGIALDTEWAEPLRPGNVSDQQAVQLKLDAKLGWFADPLFLGTYPASLQGLVPSMTAQQAAAIKGSADFLGINHYTTRYVTAFGGGFQESTTDARGKPIGPDTASAWLKVVPGGLGRLLAYAHHRYGAPELMVTENGCSTPGNATSPLQDATRIEYFRGYIGSMCRAIVSHNMTVTNYFAWSLLRNWEWTRGFTEDFGIVYVNLTTLERQTKDSARWLSAAVFTKGAPALPHVQQAHKSGMLP